MQCSGMVFLQMRYIFCNYNRRLGVRKAHFLP